MIQVEVQVEKKTISVQGEAKVEEKFHSQPMKKKTKNKKMTKTKKGMRIKKKRIILKRTSMSL